MGHLVVSAHLDALEQIGSFVEHVATEAGLGEIRTYRLRLAIDEVATDIIVHGYGEAGRTGDLHLASTIDNDWITLTIEDTAPRFDPSSIAQPDQAALASPLEDRPIGGLGLFLARRSVDELRWEPTPSGNRNVFRMKRV